MTSPKPELLPCPCGCGLQLRPEDAEKVAAAMKAAVGSGKPEPHHKPAESATAPVAQVESQPAAAEGKPEATAVTQTAHPFDPYWLRHGGSPTHY
jgi:hypothetical protein